MILVLLFVTTFDSNPKAKFDIALPAMFLRQLMQMAVITFLSVKSQNHTNQRVAIDTTAVVRCRLSVRPSDWTGFIIKHFNDVMGLPFCTLSLLFANEGERYESE
jgi:hypothetical protein